MSRRKKIVFSRHARERMESRGVSEEDVKETLVSPTRKLAINKEDITQEFRRNIGSKEIFVVVELRRDEIIVITTGWV